jgi:hypothetical protein
MKPRDRKPTHFISLGNGKRRYFLSLSDAKDYVKTHFPVKVKGSAGMYHIYPVDKSGYTSKSDGRTAFGEGNREWKK